MASIGGIFRGNINASERPCDDFDNEYCASGGRVAEDSMEKKKLSNDGLPLLRHRVQSLLP